MMLLLMKPRLRQQFWVILKLASKADFLYGEAALAYVCVCIHPNEAAFKAGWSATYSPTTDSCDLVCAQSRWKDRRSRSCLSEVAPRTRSASKKEGLHTEVPACLSAEPSFEYCQCVSLVTQHITGKSKLHYIITRFRSCDGDALPIILADLV